MKTKITFLGLLLLLGIVSSCTPTPITDNNVQKTTPIYGVGGEQSAEPDNERD